jgi:type I restriction enzyme S subunit
MTDQTTTIPKGWKMTTLGEVADVNNLTIDKNYPFNEIEYIDVASVEERRLITTQKLKLENAPSRAKRIVKDNSVLISTVRPNLKHYCYIKKSKPNLIASTGFAVINSKDGKSDPYYLYNLLTTKDFTDYLIKIADSQTSTYPAFNPSVIQNSKFEIPPLPEQRAIAAVLSSLDDKIELLREQNKTLEATAQTIFKEWFVRFNFPNENGEPYATAGGKMIDSELGPIPEGWRVGRLGDEVDTILGGTPSTEKKEYWENGTVPWINSGKVNDFRIYKPTAYITEKALNESAAKLMPKGTVVIAITGATLGQVSRLEIQSTGNQSVIGIIPNEKFSSAYLFYWMLENISKIINTATGGAQQHINKNDVNAFDFVIPTDGLLKNHHAIVNPMLEKISSNCFQIQTLSTLRDTLLPKLMKGEIRVEGFKE